MLAFEEQVTPECLKKNLSVQSREPTNWIQIWCRVWEMNPGHIGGRWVLSALYHYCTTKQNNLCCQAQVFYMRLQLNPIKFRQIKLFGFSLKWDVRQPWVKYFFLGRVENQQTQLTWAYGNESMKWTHKCILSTVQKLLTFFNKL